MAMIGKRRVKIVKEGKSREERGKKKLGRGREVSLCARLS